jgi:hypothetical protein
MAGKPAGMSGTVNQSYEGDQSRKLDARSGTPYTSRDGNPPSAKRVVSNDRHGIVIDPAAGEDMNDPASNGAGVMLGEITREADYFPIPAGAMDSPVPHGSPAFPKGAMRAENIAHLGQGKGADASQAGDVILNIGGVLSRGMEEGDTGGRNSELVDNKA